MPLSVPPLVVLFGLLLTAPAHADGVAVADASAAQNNAVERKLAEGKKLLSKGQVEQALVRFREAHEIVATPKATLLIARARRDSGELVASHGDYSTALAEARAAAQANPKYESTLEEVQKELRELEGVLGKLVIKLIHAPDGTEVTIDGEPVEAAKLSSPVLVQPGGLTVVATAPDGNVASRLVTVNAGQNATVELAFKRDAEPATFFAAEGAETSDSEAPAKPDTPDSGGGINPLVFVAGGVGVAGLATFAIAGSAANSKFDDLEEACPNGQCPPDRQADIDDGKQLQTFANIGLAVGVAGVATGVALLVFGGGGSSETTRKPSASISLGYRSIHVRGDF